MDRPAPADGAEDLERHGLFRTQNSPRVHPNEAQHVHHGDAGDSTGKSAMEELSAHLPPDAFDDAYSLSGLLSNAETILDSHAVSASQQGAPISSPLPIAERGPPTVAARTSAGISGSKHVAMTGENSSPRLDDLEYDLELDSSGPGRTVVSTQAASAGSSVGSLGHPRPGTQLLARPRNVENREAGKDYGDRRSSVHTGETTGTIHTILRPATLPPALPPPQPPALPSGIVLAPFAPGLPLATVPYMEMREWTLAPASQCDVVGIPTREPEIAAAHAIDGGVSYSIGVDSESLQQYRELKARQAAHTARVKAITSCMRELQVESMVLDNLLIEVLSSAESIEDYDLIVLTPSRPRWEEARHELGRRMIKYALRMSKDGAEGRGPSSPAGDIGRARTEGGGCKLEIEASPVDVRPLTEISPSGAHIAISEAPASPNTPGGPSAPAGPSNPAGHAANEAMAMGDYKGAAEPTEALAIKPEEKGAQPLVIMQASPLDISSLSKVTKMDQLTDLVETVFVDFIRVLKNSLSQAAEDRKRIDSNRGWFAPDYEPSFDEMDNVKIVPQSGIRGVGWNGSTKAWVASWLPAEDKRRFCATFSARKFGYHQAMKMAICQRLRAELMVYHRRKFPIYESRIDKMLRQI